MSLAALAAPARPAAAAEHLFSGILDLRLFSSNADAPWLGGGLDKLRLGRADEPLALGQALIEYRGRWSETVSAKVTAALYDGQERPVNLTEAYLEYAPVPRSAWRLRARAGAFYPPVSLANTSTGWTSPYTLSFSAIDTWIAEEVRIGGAEVEARHLGRFTGSSDDIAFTAAAFQANDPAGALISWRGWALHERQTGLFETLPLANLPAFADTGSFPPQESFEKPFVELDHRWGYYAAAEWNHLESWRVRALHYDNLGDPSIIHAGQWGWRTRFDHFGWQWRPAPHTELLAQALLGTTEMEGFTGPLVYARFWSAYLLASRALGRHRWSARLDVFGVRDEDHTPDDPNREHGHALTLAYFFTLVDPAHWGAWRLGAESLFVWSDRPARRLFASAGARAERSLQLVVQYQF